MALYINALHNSWIERYRTVNEYILSKIKVEDQCNLLNYVKQLHLQLNISPLSILCQNRHELNKVRTKTLRGMAYKLL